MIVGWDTETRKIIKRGKATTNVVPRLVCLAYDDGHDRKVLGRTDAIEWWSNAIRDESAILVAHNAVFDLAVMCRAVYEDTGENAIPWVFDALEAKRSHDTILLAQLEDIEQGGIFTRGGYTLADCVDRYLDEKVEGKKGADAWRLRYDELDAAGILPSEYPEAAYEYALMDAVYARRLYGVIEHNAAGYFQAAADWWLHLASCYGVLVDLEWSAKVDAYYARESDKRRQALVGAGLIVDGTLKRKAKREMVEAAWEELGEAPKVTKKGSVSTAKDTLQELERRGVENPTFNALIKYNRATKFRSTYMDPILDAGEAGEPLCARYNCLVNSGRTSSSGPNVQNFPARTTPAEQALLSEIPEGTSPHERVFGHGVVVGADIRGCFVPRPGKVFVACDYTALEMSTLAQVCANITGSVTALGEAINAGQDLHSRVASQILGRTYEDTIAAVEAGETEAKKARQISKILNFAAPVGASVDTISYQARNQGLTDVPQWRWEQALTAWKAAWPEIEDFWAYVSSLQAWFEGPYMVEQHGPLGCMHGWRTRKCSSDDFCAAANSLFQGLAGDGAKYAGWLLAKKQYCNTESVLYGSKTLLFVHDEFVIECEQEKAEECGQALSEVMVDGMEMFCPDITIRADYEVQEQRWKK